MSSASSSVTSAPVRLTGRVKWFNNKTGFGFISVVGGNEQHKDASEVFVHHSAVTVSQEQYRYLVEGEYVEFSVVNTETGDHKFQAGDVRGVKGGKLFCETRHENRGTQSGARTERGVQQERGQGQGRGGRVDRGGRGGSEWMLVRRDTNQNSNSRGNYGRGRGRGRGPVDRPVSASASASEAPAPAPSSTESMSDVPATPRPTAKRAPRQAKPSA